MRKFESKLHKYSAFAGSILAATTGAKAGIIYTDIDPDTTFNLSDPGSFSLDINKDTITDFVFYFYSSAYSSSSSSINYKHSNGVIAFGVNVNNQFLGKKDTISLYSTSSTSFYYPKALNKNYLINNGAVQWASPSYGGLLVGWNYYAINNVPATSISLPYWKNKTDKYIGLKIEKSGKTYYGWVRLNVSADGKTFTIKDYAYNNVAGQAIKAGQLYQTSVPEPINDNILEFVTQNDKLELSINSEYATAYKELHICNLLGQQLFLTKDIQSHYAIPLNGSRVVIVYLKDKTGRLFSKKIKTF